MLHSRGILRGLGSEPLVNKLYQLDCEVLTSSQALEAVTEKSDLWHYRLGHVNEQTLHKCQGYLMEIDVKNADKLSLCEACLAVKMHRKPFPSVGEIRSRLQLVHSVFGVVTKSTYEWNTSEHEWNTSGKIKEKKKVKKKIENWKNKKRKNNILYKKQN